MPSCARRAAVTEDRLACRARAGRVRRCHQIHRLRLGPPQGAHTSTPEQEIGKVRGLMSLGARGGWSFTGDMIGKGWGRRKGLNVDDGCPWCLCTATLVWCTRDTRATCCCLHPRHIVQTVHRNPGDINLHLHSRIFSTVQVGSRHRGSRSSADALRPQ